MQDIIVTVVGVQTDADGQETRIETVASGRMHEKNGMHYITYKEKDEEGREITTLIKANGEEMTLVRRGLVEYRQLFLKDIRQESIYRTPFGSIDMAVDTKQLEVSMADRTGSILLEYELIVDGQWQSRNELSILINCREYTGMLQ